MQFPVALGQIQPGTVEVRISAPSCELHTNAIKPMTVFADFDTPPLWFPMTPRRVGRLDVTFELVQGGAVIASVAHTIQVTAGVENDPVASVRSHGGEPPQPEPAPEPKPLEDIIVQPPGAEVVQQNQREEKPAEAERESEHDAARRRESDEQRQAKMASTSAETAHHEALDGVLDRIQTGEPPENQDEPLSEFETASDEFVLSGDWTEYGVSHPQEPSLSSPGAAPQSAQNSASSTVMLGAGDYMRGQDKLQTMTAAQARRGRSPLVFLALLLVLVAVVAVVIWLLV
jgi:hypothetical protein